MLIAIHPDDYTAKGQAPGSDASSGRWAALLQEAGHEVRWVDVFRADILDQLRGAQGFMWRWAHFGGMGRIARRLLPVLERELGLVVYPDQNTCWHYDDKIAQAYLLPAVGIPTPRTWVWFSRESALEWARAAEYPLVLKLAAGAGSSNVRLLNRPDDAAQWIDRLFDCCLTSLDEVQFEPLGWRARVRRAAGALLRGRASLTPAADRDMQTGYVLFQEFLRDNAFDTRVTVIGNRAFAFRRFNRPGDFRASGSGHFSSDPEAIDPAFVRLGFRTARALRSQSCALDGLYSGKKCVVGEISYTYASRAVYDCPGHWVLVGDPESGELIWRGGHKWPEEAQIEDFLARLSARAGSSC